MIVSTDIIRNSEHMELPYELDIENSPSKRLSEDIAENPAEQRSMYSLMRTNQPSRALFPSLSHVNASKQCSQSMKHGVAACQALSYAVC